VKSYDVGDPGDAEFLSVLKGVEHWVLSVDDADAIVLRAAAGCLGADSSRSVANSIDAHVKQFRSFLDGVARERPQDVNTPEGRMYLKLMDSLRVERRDRSIEIQVGGFGTLADLAGILEANFEDPAKQAKPPGRDQGQTEPGR
jgi:hypothetical protein